VLSQRKGVKEAGPGVAHSVVVVGCAQPTVVSTQAAARRGETTQDVALRQGRRIVARSADRGGGLCDGATWTSARRLHVAALDDVLGDLAEFAVGVLAGSAEDVEGLLVVNVPLGS
jgi:hypothetical protein